MVGAPVGACEGSGPTLPLIVTTLTGAFTALELMVTDFVNGPGLLVSYLTWMIEVAPGAIGAVSHLGTVHPHEPWQLEIMSGSVPVLVSQISKRGRDYEEAIRIDYLKRLNERYEAWISTYDLGKLLIIDIDEIKFGENKEHLGIVMDKINAEIHGLFK